MLILKSPMTFKSLSVLKTCPDILSDRIRTGHQLFGMRITGADLLHLAADGLAVFIRMEDDSTIAVEGHVHVDNALKIDLISQLVDRILLILSARSTYQDEVFAASMLRRLGIRDVRAFMEIVRQHGSRNRLIVRLLDMYFRYGPGIAEMAERTLQESGQGQESVRNAYATDLFLHDQIFRRLRTAECDDIVYQYGKHADAPACIRQAAWIEQADAIQMSWMRSNVLCQAAPAVWQGCLAYGAMPLGPDDLTKEGIARRMAAAILEHVIQKADLERQYRGEDAAVRSSHADLFYQSAEDVVASLLYLQCEKVTDPVWMQTYQEGMRTLMQDEIELVWQLGQTDLPDAPPVVQEMQRELLYCVWEDQRIQKQLTEKLRICEQMSAQGADPERGTRFLQEEAGQLRSLFQPADLLWPMKGREIGHAGQTAVQAAPDWTFYQELYFDDVPDQKAFDEKALDKIVSDQKVSYQKVSDEKAFDKKDFDERASYQKASDEKAFGKKTSDEKTPDEKDRDEKASDKIVSDKSAPDENGHDTKDIDKKDIDKKVLGAKGQAEQIADLLAGDDKALSSGGFLEDRPAADIWHVRDDHLERFLERYLDPDILTGDPDTPLMQNIRLLERIDRHNVEMKRLLDSRLPDGAHERELLSRRVSVDRVQARRDALRAIEDPQAVLCEVYEKGTAITEALPEEVRRILETVDEKTRAFYERLMGYRQASQAETFHARTDQGASYPDAQAADIVVQDGQDTRAAAAPVRSARPSDGVLVQRQEEVRALIGRVSEKERALVEMYHLSLHDILAESPGWTDSGQEAGDRAGAQQETAWQEVRHAVQDSVAIEMRTAVRSLPAGHGPFLQGKGSLYFVHKIQDQVHDIEVETVREMERVRRETGTSREQVFGDGIDTRRAQQEIREMTRELIRQSENELVQRMDQHLRAQMHTISDRVYLDIERRLRNEQRRRGY